ncbi:unnamed protein product [Arctia plantaginis]|uniref:Uncharacterized protein n=1 Tax=Arctia plantaginis TaxID=874455 RepID=A0A8S1BS41_ARCPL|nr:unnamed protein product [Arctia plantaginis]
MRFVKFKSDNRNVNGEEEPVPLQRKLGNEILTASLVMNEANEDDVSTSSDLTKKKEITWSKDTYLEKMTLQHLGVRSASWMLERKASVGPCYKQGMLFGEPSGISVCLPKKHLKHASSALEHCRPIKSGISIIISGKCSNKKSKLFGPVQFEMRRAKVSSRRKEEENAESKIKIDNYNNYYATLRDKLDNLYGRIKHALHI